MSVSPEKVRKRLLVCVSISPKAFRPLHTPKITFAKNVIDRNASVGSRLRDLFRVFSGLCFRNMNERLSAMENVA